MDVKKLFACDSVVAILQVLWFTVVGMRFWEHETLSFFGVCLVYYSVTEIFYFMCKMASLNEDNNAEELWHSFFAEIVILTLIFLFFGAFIYIASPQNIMEKLGNDKEALEFYRFGLLCSFIEAVRLFVVLCYLYVVRPSKYRANQKDNAAWKPSGKYLKRIVAKLFERLNKLWSRSKKMPVFRFYFSEDGKCAYGNLREE